VSGPNPAAVVRVSWRRCVAEEPLVRVGCLKHPVKSAVLRMLRVNRHPIGPPDRHPKGTPWSYALSD
jgi:hypothetical protein